MMDNRDARRMRNKDTNECDTNSNTNNSADNQQSSSQKTEQQQRQKRRSKRERQRERQREQREQQQLQNNQQEENDDDQQNGREEKEEEESPSVEETTTTLTPTPNDDDHVSISLSDGEDDKLMNEESDKRTDEMVAEEPTQMNATYDVLPENSTPSPADSENKSEEEKIEVEAKDRDPNAKEDDDQEKELREQELSLQREQIQSLIEQTKMQSDKIRELEVALISNNRTCSHLECLLKQELNKRSALETDNLNLISEICKLRLKLNSSDQLKKRDDEKINLLNATLMERETEISILKLKLTRAQTSAPTHNQNNSPISSVMLQQESNNNNNRTQSSISYVTNNQNQQLLPRLRAPSQTYSISRLDNQNSTGSLQRNQNLRQQPLGQLSPNHQSQYSGISNQQPIATVCPSISSLYSSPSNIPLPLGLPSSTTCDQNPGPIYGNITSPYLAVGGQPGNSLDRSDRRYRTLPRNMPSSNVSNNLCQPKRAQAFYSDRVYESPQHSYQQVRQQYQRSHSTVGATPIKEIPELCTVTNLDDSNDSNQQTNYVSTSNKRLTRENLEMVVTYNPSTSDNVSSLTVTTNPTKPIVEDSHYLTIDRLGGQASSNNIPKHGYSDRTQPVASFNITAPQHRLPSIPKQKSGLRRIFSKLRRSGSGSNDLQHTDDIIVAINNNNKSSNFKRGGSRSTTNAVFQSSSINQQHDMNMMLVNKRPTTIQTSKPFGEWDTNMIVEWLTSIGLSMYTNQCKRWAKNGAHIMNATSSEVERGLGISNILHRKKLRLAISELNGDCDKITKAAANLDYLWVARWLDDIGLPQYKEQFINNRIDGRVLNYLTVKDLVSMNITSLLHHASIRCGIRVLRSINFDIQALKRRATSDEINGMMQWSNGNQQPSASGSNSLKRGHSDVERTSHNKAIDSVQQTMYNDTSVGGSSSSINNSASSTPIATTTEAPAALGETGSGSANRLPGSMPAQPDIALWTCHRVMEWLRLIDFAEFAPNLRGSGVHGGLIIYEDGFNADLMSSLLSIPDDKTLLRRHIYSLFKELIGIELFQQKRQCESNPHYVALTPTAELKNAKKSQFSILRRSRYRSKVGQDTTIEEYLCPMYPIDLQFLKCAAANAARDAASEQQQQQITPIQDSAKASPIYANNSQLTQQNQQQQRFNQLPTESTNV